MSPKPGQHAVRVVVGTPADKGQHAAAGSVPVPNALVHKLDCRALQLVGVIAGDQHLDLTAAGRHAPRGRRRPPRRRRRPPAATSAAMPSRQLRGRRASPTGRRRRAPPQFSCPPAYPRAATGGSHEHHAPRRTELDRRGAGRAPTPRLLRDDVGRRRGLRRLRRRAAGTSALDDPDGLLDEVDRSGLLGRGGAALPARGEAAHRARRGPRAAGGAVVLANGEEGEPASVKDRWLLRHRPHLVLDGVRLAARIVGADRAYVYVSDPACRRRRASRAGRLADRSTDSPITVVTVDAGYVAGEETAAVRAVNGGPAKPTDKPPRPFEQGVGGLPDAGEQRRDPGQSAVPAAPRRGGVPVRGHVRLARHVPGDGHRRRAGRRRCTSCRTARRSPNCLRCTGFAPTTCAAC